MRICLSWTRPIAVALAAVLVLAAPDGAPALAQSSIKIIVNDSAITSMDLANRARLLQLAQKMSPGAAQAAAKEELIDDVLKIQEAKRRGIEVPDSAVESAVADIAGRSKMTSAQFARALGGAGVNISTLKSRLKAQMAWGRVVRGKVQAAVKAEQNDLIAQMRNQEKGSAEVTAEDYVLQRVVFTLPMNRSGAIIERRRREAEALRSKFNSCETGLEMARAMKEVAVLNVGRRLASEVPEQMRELVKATPEGKLTRPSVTDSGVEMLAVCRRITVTGESAVTANMDAEALSAQGQKVSDELVAELRKKANIIYR